ncbi:type VII secretion protein EccE [Amycolatopsis pithecellobii]|uniref:Type VII secretion protein EccE n=1 Tax=Amycolatopsis pithecellobii TaxID=664692 RepID=A0A6N7YL41_9PSEU|nr:type VII secretion protein EccE [Amycolatopsis pithecellobii]MTD53645.1 type VII secretion protein EccE [Amycolatopsis pithecellobii]
MTSAGARISAYPWPHGWSVVLPVRPAQIIVWALALVILLVDRDLTIVLLIAIVVGTTSVRVAGRYLADWALVWVRYRLLRHADRRLGHDPLLVLVPGFRLRQHHDRGGNSFGIAGIGDGWTAVLRLTAAGEPDLTALAGVLRAACDNADIPLAGAQLLVRTEGTQRVYLVAVRYRPAEAPLAALARGAGELGEHRAIIRAALGVAGTLAEAGITATPLEAAELAAELRETLGVKGDLLARSHRTIGVTDSWRSWSAAGTTQACFTPKASLESAFSTFADAASFTVASYQLSRTHLGHLREDVTVRAVKYQGMRRPPRAEDLGIPAIPLYGRQEAAVRQTLPLAMAR